MPEPKQILPADFDILWRTILGEARGESLEGQVAVGWVIRNRAASPARFGGSIREVCLRPLQFSCWNRQDLSFDRVVTAALPDQAVLRAMAAAALVITGEHIDPTGGADHYYAQSIKPPRWSIGMKHTVTIERHLFFREHP